MSKTRLFIATTYYPQFVTDFYKKYDDLTVATYKQQFEALMKQGFGFGDVWKYELERTGLFEVEISVMNIPELQKRWAIEHHFNYSKEDWMKSIVLEQIQQFKPHVLFAHDRIFLTPSLIRRIKQIQPSIKKIISWDGVALRDKSLFDASDLILTCNQIITDYYNANGIKSLLLPFAFDQRILTQLRSNGKKYDVSFVGSLTLRKNGHIKRLQLLTEVIKEHQIDLWLSSFDENKIYFLKQMILMARNGGWNEMKGALRLAMRNHGEAFGMTMYQILAESQITLNSHIDVSFNNSGNSRLWEATGVGTCLLTDWKDNIADLFIPDEEIVVYHSPEECVEKIDYLLAHPETMNRIAKAGQKRTLEEYNYATRLKQVIPLLLDY